MDQNSILEYGSKANVILRFIASTDINGKQYAANEPYLYLKNVDIIISYSNISKRAETNLTVSAFSDIKPRFIGINGIPFTRKVVSLLSKFENSGQNFSPTKFRTLTASRGAEDEEGIIFLIDDVNLDKPIFVYDNEFEPVWFAYDDETNALISENFLDGGQYLISFSSEEQGTKFELNKPCLPYMSLEIQGIGNLDKASKKVYLFFDKVSLDSEMEFSFIQDEIMRVPLQFNIINDENNLIYFED